MVATEIIELSDMDLQYSVPSGYTPNTKDSIAYFTYLESAGYLPFSKVKIHYADNQWDFRPYCRTNVQRSVFLLNFSSAPEAYKKDLKNYALLRLFHAKVKIQMIHRDVVLLGVFFSYAVKNGVYDVISISAELINDFLSFLSENKKISPISIDAYKGTIKNFYRFYHANFHEVWNDELKEILSSRNVSEYEAYKENHKSKQMPEDYFNRFVSACVKVMTDCNETFDIRASAAIYLILSQTGLRIGELLMLKSDCIQEKITFSGETINYLHYRTWKGVHGQGSKDSFTYINDLSRSAVDVLRSLPEFIKRRTLCKQDYLYMGSIKTSMDTLPVSPMAFRNSSFKLMMRFDELGILETVNLNTDAYPYLSSAKYNRNDGRTSRSGEKITTIWRPTTQQFRFHVCTELYRKGVSVAYIQRFMSHLSKAITEYHIYKDDEVQEDIVAAKKVLKGIITGDTRILGNDKDLTSRIHEFIKANNYNIERDMDSILEKLANEIPVRIKTGGVCIKSSKFRDCSVDARTNKFYCAYNVCPNVFHFYYHCSVSWRKVQELIEAIHINEKKGCMRQLNKDRNNLLYIIKTHLLPELEELDEMVQKKGADNIYREYPDLNYIVENHDEIKKEALKWIKTLTENA